MLPLLLNKLGCSRKVVGPALPIGYSFNLDGASIHVTLCIVFLVTGAEHRIADRPAIAFILVAAFASKGASAATAAAFVTLAATLAVFPAIPPAELLLISAVNHFLSECAALSSRRSVGEPADIGPSMGGWCESIVGELARSSPRG